MKCLLLLLLLCGPIEPYDSEEFYTTQFSVAHTFKEDLEGIIVVQTEGATNYYYFRKLATDETVSVDCTYENSTKGKPYHYFDLRVDREKEGATLTFYDNYPGIFREVRVKWIMWVFSEKYFYIPIDGFNMRLKDPPEELLWDDEDILKLLKGT